LLVYGDHKDFACPRHLLGQLGCGIEQIRRMPSGMIRHTALQSLLIEAGRLQQGVADADFAAVGKDRATTGERELAAFTHKLALSLLDSWRSGGAHFRDLPAVPEIADLPPRIETKVPEGFAFYAVYPEAFAEAALCLNLSARSRVIGIRSIGTTLAAVAAAALGAPPPSTVRPFGDPFDRKIEVDAALEYDLFDEAAHFVIVDEGPGLSGSSFGSVADWLEARGVPADRIAFLCSHNGAPGTQALPRHRQRWERTQRAAGDFGPRLRDMVGKWAEDLLGPLDEAPREVSGGEWRQLAGSGKHGSSPANPFWERRKFLIRAAGQQWLAKFAGLGREGERKLDMAKKLHAWGLVAEPIGLANGFLVERWHEDGRPLSANEQPLQELAYYLGTRARLLSAPRPGASIADLLQMARRNASLALGDWADERLQHWTPRTKALQERVVATCTDGKLERHEWIRLPDGRLLKTDALDHHASHDLIGCQDLAWDVAGVAVEFALSPHQARWLAASAGHASGRLVDPELLLFMQHAYLAFRIGQSVMSEEMCDGADARRWRDRAAAYSEELERRLRSWEPNATRGISSIDQQPERTGAGTILWPPG
jgi:hypothetical protein